MYCVVLTNNGIYAEPFSLILYQPTINCQSQVYKH